MSFGKMNKRIQIIAKERIKDADGFATDTETVVLSLKAYIEERHGNEAWKNRAAFTSATALFRFRSITSTPITTAHFIRYGGKLYNIESAEDVRGKGMYTEVLATMVEGSKK